MVAILITYGMILVLQTFMNYEVLFSHRHYVQPQWIFDSVNARELVSIDDYVPGAILPPHLSPFVEEKEDDYVPPERRALIEKEKELLKSNAKVEKEDDEGEGEIEGR